MDAHHPGADVVVGHGTDGLERLSARAAPVECVGDHPVGVGEVVVDLAEGELAVERDVAAQRLVHQRCAVDHRLQRIDDGFQRFVLDDDERGRILGDRPRLGGDGDHALTVVADLFEGKATPRMVGRIRPEVGKRIAQLGRLGPGDDGQHSIECLGGRGVDADDPGVAVDAANQGDLEHVG